MLKLERRPEASLLMSYASPAIAIVLMLIGGLQGAGQPGHQGGAIRPELIQGASAHQRLHDPAIEFLASHPMAEIHEVAERRKVTFTTEGIANTLAEFFHTRCVDRFRRWQF